MKIKTISRSADDYVPVKNTQESQIPRNLDPALHPFERAREYTKALNATKMERMFAKPFVGQLGDGHRDGVYCIAKNFKILNQVASGSGDGMIKYWNVSSRTELCTFKAHYNLVTGLSVTPNGGLLSCGDDKTIKLWSVNSDNFAKYDYRDDSIAEKGLVKSYLGAHAFQSIDHHREDPIFATGGALIELWDESRSKPISNLSWGADNITSVKFNMTETSVLASTGSDNSIVLYDIRTNSPTQKLVQTMRTNSLCWNPMEAFNFVTANEDHNLYYYDMRNMSRALNVYKDHVAAVMDVDFSPTGEEIVSGSYDKTIRIFNVKQGHSREIYHTKRMQHVFQVKFTMDSKFILSGSDDGNVRVWRSQAHERSNVKSAKEKAKLEYDEKLKERFKHMPEIRRIAKHRHVPLVIKKAQEIKRIELDSLKRREQNRKRTAKGERYIPEREKQIVGTVHKYAKRERQDDDE